MKGQLEIMRTTNSFGVLIWQLNENWPTGGWGVVEWGPDRNLTHQVVGGRWKPLMYLLRNHIFQDVVVACGAEDRCFARNDGPNEVDVFVSMEAWDLTRTRPLRQLEWYPHLQSGRSTAQYHLPTGFREKADVILINVHSGSLKNEIQTSAFLWNAPVNITGLDRAHITVQSRQDDDGAVILEVMSTALVLYVVLSTAEAGMFSDNAFHLRPRQRKIVRFEPIPGDAAVDIDRVRETLRVEHLGSHRRTNDTLPQFFPLTQIKVSSGLFHGGDGNPIASEQLPFVCTIIIAVVLFFRWQRTARRNAKYAQYDPI